MSENLNKENMDKTLLDRKKRQEEFLERVESKLRRSEKDIWFINNEDHPHKEGLSKGTSK